MGRNYNADFDENELMDELGELDAEIASEQLGTGLGQPSYIPNSNKVVPDAVPASGQPQANQAEADALKSMMDI